MIIDTHCHFDMMPNPEQYLKQQEVKKKIMMVVGACLFLIAAAQALPLFFGINA